MGTPVVHAPLFPAPHIRTCHRLYSQQRQRLDYNY